jgi:hypothetical protein
MFTIFHLLEIIGIVTGLILGIKTGYGNFGWSGAIIGAVLGASTGLILAKIPFRLGLWYLRLELKRSDTNTLIERLKREKSIPHLIKAELAGRGEILEKK